MNNNNFNINLNILVILFSFLITIGYANFNISKYDKNLINQEGKKYHVMIKHDVFRYFSHGDEIKEDIKNGKSYFETGRNNFTKYLYPRIIALYYLIFDYNLFEDKNNDNIKTGVHFKFLFFQVLLYYLSIFFLYSQIKKKLDEKILFFSLIFLCIEPTIIQYHGAFWSESIFFSIQILLMALILNEKETGSKYFILGILLSILALQRSNGLYYIVPVIVYLYIIHGLSFTKKVPYTLIGFLVLLMFVGLHNFKKTGKFYFIPLETKAVLHAYVIENILDDETYKNEKKNTIKKLKKTNLNIDYSYLDKLNYSRFSFTFCEHIQSKNKKENLEFLNICEYLNKRSKEIVLANPLETVKFIARRSISFIILNPFHIYSDHKFYSGSYYYHSETHKKLLPYRIIYSFIVYLICIVGLISLLKLKNKNILIFILLSSIYFFSILSWQGSNRYFTPVLIYISFLFGSGTNEITKIIKRNLIK